MAAALLAVSGLSGCGCGDDDGTTMDAGTDAGGLADGFTPDVPMGRPCTPGMDEGCDDGVGCTNDICDPLGFCRNQVDPAVCDDGIFCNGLERCNPERLGTLGCEPSPPESCNDEDVCTIDSCDEVEKTCRHGPRDFDEDGEADWHCTGGSDCDDGDPTRSSSASEICTDGVDNDCDEETDEPDCGRPPHDLCDDPLDVTGGGVFEVSTTGATADYMLGCGGSGWREVALTFTITEAQDVRIRAMGTISVTAVALRTACEDRLTEMECASGFPGEIRRRNLMPGTYYVLVSSSNVDELVVEVEFSTPTPPPMNETCATPTDVTAGGRFTGSFVDVRDDTMTACGFAPAPDVFYVFTTTELRDVAISLVSTMGDQVNFAIRRACTDRATEFRCVRGAPAAARLHELPAGTYYIVAEGPTFRETDFTLDIEFLAPTPPPPGDTCAAPIPLTLGVTTLGTLADKEDDHDVSCSFYNRDAVYSFTLTERSDVTVLVDGGGSFVFGVVRTDCDDRATELRCSSGIPSRSRIRNLAAGTYYVLVEGFTGTGFNITVTATPPTTPVRVTGNDNCTTAHSIPVTGGLFTGNTTTMAHDYEATCGGMARSPDVAYELVLPSMKRVTASTDGSVYDTVLHLHGATCVSRTTELACDDDAGGGGTSLIDRVLAAGTYHFVVDGFAAGSSGEYTFEVLVSDP